MKVITCFSYKGGSGRTVAAANIASALASIKEVAAIKKPLERKVALIDLDVFSAGTHRVFGISNQELADNLDFGIQDYLLEQIEPTVHLKENALTFSKKSKIPLIIDGGANYCDKSFTLFPAKPRPDQRFVVQKFHENLLLELMIVLEKEGYHYVIIDGESGARSMADIALRLSDIVLMFFRLTWQHVEGTQSWASKYIEMPDFPPFYIIPTCVPLVEDEDKIYLSSPGFDRLKKMTSFIPRESGLNDFAEKYKGIENAPKQGFFWAKKICIHESLILKGGESIIVYNPQPEVANERAAQDYYEIASYINSIHPPG